MTEAGPATVIGVEPATAACVGESLRRDALVTVPTLGTSLPFRQVLPDHAGRWSYAAIGYARSS